MQAFADRFVVDRGEPIDLATGELIRLTVEAVPDRATTLARTRLCDQLSSLRHPLLVPLVDYGVAHDQWFEAHVMLPPMRASSSETRRRALHLGRFLQACGIEIPRDAVERHVRTALDSLGPCCRTVGVHLTDRDALDTIRVLFDAAGPPGTSSATILGAHGAGLRTFVMQSARLARLAGLLRWIRA